MVKFKIKSLTIKSFRGIKDYRLDLEKSLVLCGENGSGKSSIVNAFEYLFTGKVAHLSGTQTIKHDKSLVHIGDEPEDLLVEAEIGKRKITRTLTQAPKPDDVIEDFKNGSFLLNRKKLLTFIESRPKARYKNITSLIGFEELDEIEDTLYRTQKEFKKKLENKENNLNSKIKSITDIYNCEIDEVYEKINEILSKNDLEELNENTSLKQFLKEFSKNDFEKINKLTKIMDLFDFDIPKLNQEFEKLLLKYETATLSELKTTNKLLKILNESYSIIANENLTKCPLCQSTINSQDVIKYIDLKKKELEKNENTLNNWKKESTDFINKLKNLNFKLNNLQETLSGFEEYEFNFELDDLIRDLDKLSEFDINLSKINKNALIELDDEFNKLKNDIQSDFEKLNDKQNHKDLNNVYEIVLKLEDKQVIEEELKIIENQYHTAKTTYDLFKQEKKSALEHIIKEIENHVNKYYNFIHYNENFNSPKINVPQSQKLNLNLNFNDVTADPQSYSSEGHLDSLGLCIFLAFAKKFNKYDFIILDDIISTVDLGHKEKIIKLLFTEFKDYKFIITTHNKLWLRQMKYNAISSGIQGGFDFLEIRKLDENTGPVLSKTKIPTEMIKNYIDNGDTYAAGNSIRRHLESVLENVCKANQIPVPLKEHLMVDDYYNAINKFFEGMFDKANPKIKEYYDEVFEKLNSSRYMGNLLSHNDEANNYVSINEIENFKDAVFNFEKSMICEKHDKSSQYLRFDKTAKIAECSKNKCKSHILLK